VLDKQKCRQCRDALREVLDAVHSFNNKLTVISGTSEYVSHDPSLADDGRRMLALTEKACFEYAKRMQNACESIEKCIREIEWCLKEHEKNG
jgi:hypothetical protein